MDEIKNWTPAHSRGWCAAANAVQSGSAVDAAFEMMAARRLDELTAFVVCLASVIDALVERGGLRLAAGDTGAQGPCAIELTLPDGARGARRADRPPGGAH